MNKKFSTGFTLVELAVVIVIIGLIIGGMFVPISAQMDMQAYKKTNASLDEIKEALIGYAMVNGRLPCPALSTSSGLEQPVGGGACAAKIGSDFAVGYLPAATLGITPTDNQGFAVDGWGADSINRIRYAVRTKAVGGVSDPFTTINGMKVATLSAIGSATYFKVCSAAPTGSVCGGAQLSDSAVFVIYSVGKNAGTSGSGDESANPNPQTADADGNGVPDADDGIFVSHDQTSAFDDILLWVPSSTLISRMVSAGQLP